MQFCCCHVIKLRYSLSPMSYLLPVTGRHLWFPFILSHSWMWLLYIVLSAWGGYLSKELEGRIDAFLRRMFSFGYCSQLHSVKQLIVKGDETLLHKSSQPSHCLNQLLPPFKNTSNTPRSGGHNFVLPSCHFEHYKRSFINRCLFNYVTIVSACHCLLSLLFTACWRICHWLIKSKDWLAYLLAEFSLVQSCCPIPKHGYSCGKFLDIMSTSWDLCYCVFIATTLDFWHPLTRSRS